MIGMALGLITLTLAELVAGGLSGRPAGRVRSLVGIGVAASSAIAGCWLFGLQSTVWFVALAVAGAAGWLLFRSFPDHEPVCAAAALASFGLYSALLVTFSGEWGGDAPGGFQTWLGRLPFSAMVDAGPERLMLIVGIVLALTAPSNGLVRAVLSVAGSEIMSAEERLRGGRYIGILERILIFGLAIAGELAAAALIGSAKSILRFPELSRVARLDESTAEPKGRTVADVDIVTEYFLLGSLVSWFTALAPVPLLAA